MKRLNFPRWLIRYRRPLLVFCVILAIYSIFSIAGLLIIPRLKTYDIFLNIKYKVSPMPKSIGDIAIIAIDDSAYYTYGKKWPWRREIFANLIYKLIAHKPSVIGFDLAFVGESIGGKANDFLFAESIKDAGNVILASFYDQEGRHILPLDEFRDAAIGCGFTNKPEDIDNYIRETKIFETHLLKGEIIDYSFDVLIACAFKGVTAEDLIRPLLPGLGREHRKGVTPIDYTAKLADFLIYSFNDVIHDRVPEGILLDKIVLIGVTGEVFQDISLTPFGRMPGVGIIANSIMMLLENNLIYRIPPFIDILLILFLCWIISVVTSRRSMRYATLVTGSVLLGFILISVILIINNVVWDFFSSPILVLAIYLTNSLTNYAGLLVQSRRIRKFVFSDVLTGLPTRRYFLLRLDSALKNIREREAVSLVLFSVNNFPLIVSQIGEERANSVLKESGVLISKYSRRTRGVDFIARYAETEFCCILHNTPEKGALSYANRMIQNLITRVNSTPPLTINAGIVDIRLIKKKSPKLCVEYAGIALARGLREGVNKVCVYNPEIDKVPETEYMKETEMSESDLSFVTEELQEKYHEMAILVNKLRTAQEEVIKGERLSAMGKVAATIYHDLSKPIVNIRSGLERVRSGLDKMDLSQLKTPKAFINTTIEETKRLEDLLERLKELYRPKEKEFVPVFVNQILEEMLALSEGKMVESNIRLAKLFDGNLPMVMADSGELKQVFLNLIHNAIESMSNGGELGICTLVSEQNMVEIQVKDTGCGIPPENINRIFDAFFTTKKEEKGAGLGLYASLEIIRKYGGDIKVESALGKGSIFKVTLPRMR